MRNPKSRLQGKNNKKLKKILSFIYMFIMLIIGYYIAQKSTTANEDLYTRNYLIILFVFGILYWCFFNYLLSIFFNKKE